MKGCTQYWLLADMQDTTTRIWDIRQPGKSLAVLSGRMGAVRSLRFSSDGRFLAMAEPADFVHVFDVKAGFQRFAPGQAAPCTKTTLPAADCIFEGWSAQTQHVWRVCFGGFHLTSLTCHAIMPIVNASCLLCQLHSQPLAWIVVGR